MPAKGRREVRREKPGREEVYTQIAGASGKFLQAYSETFVEPELRKIWKAVYLLAVIVGASLGWITGVTATAIVAYPLYRDVKADVRRYQKNKEGK